MRVLAGVLAVSLGGCSFIQVRGPAGPRRPDSCTKEMTAPIVDAVMAGGLGIGGGVALNASPPEDCNDFGCGLGAGYAHVMGAVLAGIAVVYLISAVYGYAVVSDCQAAHEAED